MWGRQRSLWWTSGETLLTTSHWLLAVRLWRESAALNSYGCTSQKISPGTPTLQHSPRKPNSAPLPKPSEKSKSPSNHRHHILQMHLWECADQLHHWPYSRQWTQLQGSSVSLSPLHPGYFICTMLLQSQQHCEGPHPSLPQSLPAPTIRRTVPEHQSPFQKH